jgi:hypothetical protein
MRSLFIYTCLFMALGISAQVKVDKPIVLTGADADLKQVHGIGAWMEETDAINAETELAGTHRYTTPVSGSTLDIDLQSIEGEPIVGTQLLVRTPDDPLTGPIQITVNGQGPYPLTFAPADPVDGSYIPPATIISIIYTGSEFQLVHGRATLRRPCPDGMVAVNDQFCIQTERDPVLMEFFPSITACNSIGARLCTWGEYYAACSQATDLGISAMPSGWEWTNQTANEDGNVRVVGNTSCFQASTSQPTTPRYYRCCYSR